uniref:Uncharacterized protein n=1 Tax=Anguilla anguilla TaxID=7936 RepID=A0A0E9WQ46_ANGAN
MLGCDCLCTLLCNVGGGVPQKYVEPGGTLGHHDKERADKLQ